MSVALCGRAALCGMAQGDEGEWRVSAGGGGTLANVRVGGASGTGVGYGAHGRLDYGLSNAFELGLVGSCSHASDVSFEGAALEGQSGKLFADLSTASIGAELRWTPGVGLARAFERTGPYVAAHAGGMVVMRTSQQLFTATKLLLVEPGNDLHLTPFAGGALGVEHRFGDHFFLAAEIGASFGVDERSFGLTAEAAWSWY